MIKIFIDTSIILAACKSKSGGSSYVLMLCRKGEVQGYISHYVVFEAKTKLTSLLTQQEKQRLNFLLLQCKLIIILEPLDREIQKYTRVIEKKDVPILAGAKSANTHYLLTLNTKDFIREKVKMYMRPIQITTPRDFLQKNIT